MTSGLWLETDERLNMPRARSLLQRRNAPVLSGVPHGKKSWTTAGWAPT